MSFTAVKIADDRKIVDFEVAKDGPETTETSKAAAPEAVEAQPGKEDLTDTTKRPDDLRGSTYKVKPPVLNHALYVTINDIIMNESTQHEERRPFEVFINSKEMENYQWIAALTLVISAVFRKGGDVSFLAEELKGVFDPKGGYWKPGGVYVPSVVAEIGLVIEQHLQRIGMIETPQLDEHQKKLIADKRAQLATKAAEPSPESNGDFPENAQLCVKCSTRAVVLMDGCWTCLNCADSKCS